MNVLQLVVEPRRSEILQLIWDDELSVSAISEQVSVSTAAVSQHLAKLLAAGVVSVRQDGKRRMYRAERSALAELAPMLEAMWAVEGGVHVGVRVSRQSAATRIDAGGD